MSRRKTTTPRSKLAGAALNLSLLCAPAWGAGSAGAWELADPSPAPASRMAQARAASGPETAPPLDLRLRNAAIIASGAGLFALYGRAKWWDTGFSGQFRTTTEGWFGRNTRYGGADKLGHAYSNYATVRLLTPVFESVGNSHAASTKLAAWTAIGIFTGIEVVDGYSRRWRFSPEDALANVAGTVLGAALESNPQLDAMLDFRVDYRPSPGSGFDPFGDYSGQKYLLVVKADGFARFREHKFLRYLEVGVGYGARGFDNGGERRRDLYVGVSLNLSRLLADGFYGGRMHSTPVQRGADRFFELVQVPTIGYVRHSLD